jgi:hypothetical protein
MSLHKDNWLPLVGARKAIASAREDVYFNIR